MREIYPGVKNVRKPRQKQARWILVDFETEAQAEEFKALLVEKKDIAGIKVKVNKFNIQVHNGLVRPENERQQNKNSISKQAFKMVNVQDYSNKLMASNLPENIKKEEIAELFPGHLELVLMHKPRPRAFITYSSVQEAFEARKQVRPIIDGQKFKVIILLLDGEKREKKNLKPKKEETPVEMTTMVKVDRKPDAKSKDKKAKRPAVAARKKAKNQFVRPPRYFEAEKVE